MPNLPQFDPFTMSILIVVGIVAWKVLDRVVDYFWKRVIKDDYLTVKACDKCKAERKDSDNDFRKEVREKLGVMTGALVVMAAGKEVTLEEIQKLLTAGLAK